MFFTVEDLRQEALRLDDVIMVGWLDHLIDTFGDVGGLEEHLSIEQQQADVAAEMAEKFLRLYLLQTTGMSMNYNAKTKAGIEKFVALAADLLEQEKANPSWSLYDTASYMLFRVDEHISSLSVKKKKK